MFADYIQHGWKLCSIDRGKKAPTYDDWNEPKQAAAIGEAAEGLDGAGLLHALSGTCAIDLDNLDTARPWFAERGVDIDELLNAADAVRIDSGRPGRAKLLYRMKRPLRTIKPEGAGLELRCATAQGKSVQDVLPPTQHPDTKKPYRWLFGEPLIGDWRNLPPIPASLLTVWRELAAGESTTPVQVPTGTDRPAIDLAKLRRAAFRHSPDCEYPEWVKVCAQLNDGTGGSQEGLDIFCEWSRGITRKPYPGDSVCKAHYVSFNSTAGKHLATGERLVGELPADADEFPEESLQPEASPESTVEQLKETARELRKVAIGKLEQRLVFVHSVERYFDCERHKVIGSDNAIEHMFTHMMPKTKAGRLSPVKVLKESSTKRFVDAVGFHPGEGPIFKSGYDSYANGYRNRLPKALEPTAAELEKITWLFDRIDDPPYRAWLLQFYGHVVQRPGVKIKSAPLIWSDTQGNGKTTLVRMIPSLLVGAQYSREVNNGLLNSDFNDYLLNAWHINLTEFRAGSKGERESISKRVESWIADDVVSMHPKGSAGYTMPNHFFVTGSSNSDDAAAISNNDRKWGIHEMHALQFTESEQRWVYNEFLLTPRAAGVLRHYFLNVSLAGFVASARAPDTAARQEMVEASSSADFDLLRTALEQRSEPLHTDVVLTAEVTSYVHKHCHAKPSPHRIGRMLCRAPFGGKPIQFRDGQSVYRGVVLRNHEEWDGANGKTLMAHIAGDDVDITV